MNVTGMRLGWVTRYFFFFPLSRLFSRLLIHSFAHFLLYSFTLSPSHRAAIQQVGSRQSGLYLISKGSLSRSLSGSFTLAHSLIHTLSLRLVRSVRFPPLRIAVQSRVCLISDRFSTTIDHIVPFSTVLYLKTRFTQNTKWEERSGRQQPTQYDKIPSLQSCLEA